MDDADLANLMNYFELVCLKKLIENIRPETTPRLMSKKTKKMYSGYGFGLRASNTTDDKPKEGFADIIGK